MKDVSIGQYYAADSVVHRLDARLKLMLTVAFIVMVFFVDSFFGYGVLFVCILAVTCLSKVPLLKLFRALRGILFLLLFTVVLTLLFFRDNSEPLVSWWIFRIYETGLKNAGRLSCRLILLVTGPTILTLTTTPVALTDAMERLLKPLSWIKLPVHEFAMIMSIALRLIPTFSEEAGRIISAQKARCAEFESRNLFKRAKAIIPILIPLFVSAFGRADDLAYAMDSRCYHGSQGRTRMKVMRYGLRDLFAAVLFGAVFFGILLLRYNWWSFDWVALLTGI